MWIISSFYLKIRDDVVWVSQLNEFPYGVVRVQPALPVESLSSGIVCFLILAAVSVPAGAQIVVKNEDVTFKFGVRARFGPTGRRIRPARQGYQQNFFLRRARIIVAGDVGKDVSFFFETDDPKLGITPKNLATGFIIQDAMMEWRPSQTIPVERRPVHRSVHAQRAASPRSAT